MIDDVVLTKIYDTSVKGNSLLKGRDAEGKAKVAANLLVDAVEKVFPNIDAAARHKVVHNFIQRTGSTLGIDPFARRIEH